MIQGNGPSLWVWTFGAPSTLWPGSVQRNTSPPGHHSIPPPYSWNRISEDGSCNIVQRFPGAFHNHVGHLGNFKAAFSLPQGPKSIVYTDGTLIAAEEATVIEVQERHARYRLRTHSRFGSLFVRSLQASPSVTISCHFSRPLFSRL